MKSKFTQTNGLKLHYLIHKGELPTIILMHGLTANAHCFDGLISAGLSPKYNCIAVDLRGRGLSDKPLSNYSIAEHAKDIIGLLDNLDRQKAIIGGHSFGAYVSYYIAANYASRVDKLILLDAAVRLHPKVKELLLPTKARLGKVFSSFDNYLEEVVKKMSFNNQWDDNMLSYYKADLRTLEDGSVTPRTTKEIIDQCSDAVLEEPWLTHIKKVNHKAILINATEPYGCPSDPPLLPKEMALETVDIMPNCKYKEVSGNHQTMLYGNGAKQTVQAIHEFLNT